jgi:hypothetical protein
VLALGMGRRSSVAPAKPPRLARCLVDPEYSGAILWFGPLIVYLKQLGLLVGEDLESLRARACVRR